MLSIVRRGSARKVQRPRARLWLSVLEDRSLPSNGLTDIAVLSARLEAPTSIQFTYQVQGALGAVHVGVFRSADPTFDPTDVPVGGFQTLTPSAAGGGQTGHFALAAELPIDPARKYVLVVANPDKLVAEQNEANNTAFFRTLVIGAVAHGFTLTGTAPDWTTGVAAVLKQRGYDAALPFNWAPFSQMPTPNVTVLAGQVLANWVRTAAGILAVMPNDVVDVHLIGHSRGTAVVSQAFQDLQQNPGPPALQLGFFKETLLDPHVARNQGTLAAGLAELSANTGLSQVGQFSYNPLNPLGRAFGVGTLLFQAATQDPPAFVPANVDQAEVFYQRLTWDQVAPGGLDRLIGFNFVPPPLESVPNLSGKPVLSLNVGAFGIGHYGVPVWYLATGVPSLG